MSAVDDAIAAARAAVDRGVPPMEIAARLGVSVQAVYSWTSGRKKPHECRAATVIEVCSPRLDDLRTLPTQAA